MDKADKEFIEYYKKEYPNNYSCIVKQAKQEIINEIDSEIKVLKRRFRKIPKELLVFFIDYNLIKEKHGVD